MNCCFSDQCFGVNVYQFCKQVVQVCIVVCYINVGIVVGLIGYGIIWYNMGKGCGKVGFGLICGFNYLCVGVNLKCVYVIVCDVFFNVWQV